MASRDELVRAAEDHFLHGHFLAAWITDYVDLEESLAVGSLAQEELAHAATVLELAGHDAAERDRFVFERPLDEWWPTRLLAHKLHDWPATVIRGLLLATAATVRSRWLLTSSEAVLRDAAAVMLAEQELHVTHWSRWLHVLGSSERTHEEMRHRVGVVLPLAADLFSASHGVAENETRAGLRREWLDHTAPVLERAGLPTDGFDRDPIPRSSADRQPELVETFSQVRALRIGGDDGVRGMYR